MPVVNASEVRTHGGSLIVAVFLDLRKEAPASASGIERSLVWSIAVSSCWELYGMLMAAVEDHFVSRVIATTFTIHRFSIGDE